MYHTDNSLKNVIEIHTEESRRAAQSTLELLNYFKHQKEAYCKWKPGQFTKEKKKRTK